MMTLLIYLTYKQDCKKIGKENLAVSLKERLCYLYFYIGIFILLGIFTN